MKKPGEIGERSAHAKGERDDAHVLDRRIGEQSFDVVAAVKHEASENERHEAERDHEWTGGDRRYVGGQQHLETQNSIERDIEKQARQYRRDRRRPFGMRIRKPSMHWRKAHLRSIA